MFKGDSRSLDESSHDAVTSPGRFKGRFCGNGWTEVAPRPTRADPRQCCLGWGNSSTTWAIVNNLNGVIILYRGVI